MKEELQQKIDKYLMHQMSDEERTAFEKEVDSNEELQEQLSFTEEVQQVLNSRNDKLMKIREWENDRSNKAKKSSVKRIYYWTSGIAALFIVGLLTFSTYISPYLKNSRTKDSIADNNINKTNNEYEIIETLLANCDYEKALRQIESKEFELQFKVGIYGPDTASIDTTDSDEKVTIPDNSKANNDGIGNKYESEYEYILWLKAQALIGLNRIEEATSVLEWLQFWGYNYDAQVDSLYNLIYK